LEVLEAHELFAQSVEHLGADPGLMVRVERAVVVGGVVAGHLDPAVVVCHVLALLFGGGGRRGCGARGDVVRGHSSRPGQFATSQAWQAREPISSRISGVGISRSPLWKTAL